MATEEGHAQPAGLINSRKTDAVSIIFCATSFNYFIGDWVTKKWNFAWARANGICAASAIRVAGLATEASLAGHVVCNIF